MKLDITKETILDSDNNPRQAVGLFARDSYGTGIFELSALSTASGPVLSVTPSTSSSNANLGNVTLNPSPNFIGIVTVANPGAAGMSTLFGGPNQIGSVTISNQIDVRSLLSTTTLFAVVNTGAVGNTNALATLLAGPNQIGSVTVSNTVTTQITGLVSLASGTEVRSLTTILPRTDYIGLMSVSGNVAVSNFVAPNVGNVTLNASNAYIGLATVTMSNSLTVGMLTLFPGPNFIGLVTVGNNPNVTVSNLLSLASGTEIRSLATVLNQLPLVAGTAQIGSVTVSNVVNSIVTIAPRTDYLGFMTVTTANPGSAGMVTLFPGPNQIGSVTISHVVNSIVTIAPRTDYIGLVTATIVGTVNTGMLTIFPGPNFIGLTTTVNAAGTAQIGSVTVSNFPLGLISNATVATTFIDTIPLGQFGGEAKTSLSSGAFHPLQSDNSGYLALGVGSRYVGLASVNIGGTLPALTAGAAYVGLASVNIGGTLPALTAGAAYIGLASVNIGGTLPALTASSAYVGLVSVSGTVGVTGLISLASGTEVRSLTTILPRTDYFGLVSVSGNVVVSSLPATPAGGNYIGLVTTTWGRSPILGAGDTNAMIASTATGSMLNVGMMGRTGNAVAVDTTGRVATLNTHNSNVTLNASSAFIGLVTVGHVVNSIATLAPRTDYIGLVSVSGNVAVSSLPALVAGTAQIGSVTNSLARGMTTSFATVYSATGNSTLFAPPAGTRWFIHNLMVNSQGNQNGNILSALKPVWPFVGLATTGGFAVSFESPGLPARAIDEAFLVTLNSAVTTSFAVTAHFE